MEFEFTILALSSLIIISIGLLRVSSKFGVPALLIFLSIGMLAGSDGLLGIPFSDAELARKVGSIALAFILFSGGLETDWTKVRPVLWMGISLGSVGVLLTCVIVGLFSVYVLGFPPLVGFLLGAVVSSTDAAAVFNVLRTSNTGMRKGLTSLLELESGSNDPLAVLLTTTILGFVGSAAPSFELLVWEIFKQFTLGILLGLLLGYWIYRGMNRIKLDYEGLYPVLLSASVLFVYAATELIGGNPFLAVYIAGIIIGNRSFVHKRSNVRFMDGIGWLMQIVMFLTLGLLVFPSRIPPVAGIGIAFSIFLMLIARPISVFISLTGFGVDWREKILISWVGLRGAAPIILATFPYAKQLPESEMIFHLVFFTVLTSLLLQGSTIPYVVRLLGLQATLEQRASYPFEFENKEQSDTHLLEYIVPYGSASVGKFVYELDFPENSLITLIYRGDSHIVPTGKTKMEDGDVLLVLTPSGAENEIREILSRMSERKIT
ncbi:transporter, CPA2 family [Leptospira fainei serovar Hurstbridge str. BUT 6]|uniref:Transporter, CPA2 family n=1 Tax=Leptospira fainei serovar Hurstbridge str. BUT 6 TaxID=1193011 RepID=S3UWD1_9LEPT|nr:potassium/proton antiporter [Leptospira fainei]EPG73538.1 transporter, CPA2 family [Leptospira fainei serovar Hurstbridge str. BUT 6]